MNESILGPALFFGGGLMTVAALSVCMTVLAAIARVRGGRRDHLRMTADVSPQRSAHPDTPERPEPVDWRRSWV